MHGTSNVVRYVDSQQAKIFNLYRNTKYTSKLLRTNAAICATHEQCWMNVYVAV
jgi:hypothetical protein